jgi:SAM-dependent methyltransferase
LAPSSGLGTSPGSGRDACQTALVPENRFDETVASTYDRDVADMFEPALIQATVEFLVDLAGDGAALELGVGTGRIALPLSRAGVRVHGIDISSAMVAQMQAKPGSEEIGVTIGDYATTTVDGTFRLAYLVFNTITNLITQDEQVECFRNVAAHLEPGGCFVIEVHVPELQRFPPGETVRPFTMTPTHLGFDRFEFAKQILHSHHYYVEEGTMRATSAPYRYVWPAELDLMARIAGMRLRERWNDWDRSPFTDDSRTHVSVWEKPTADLPT